MATSKCAWAPVPRSPRGIARAPRRYAAFTPLRNATSRGGPSPRWCPPTWRPYHVTRPTSGVSGPSGSPSATITSRPPAPPTSSERLEHRGEPLEPVGGRDRVVVGEADDVAARRPRARGHGGEDAVLVEREHGARRRGGRGDRRRPRVVEAGHDEDLVEGAALAAEGVEAARELDGSRVGRNHDPVARHAATPTSRRVTGFATTRASGAGRICSNQRRSSFEKYLVARTTAAKTAP